MGWDGQIIPLRLIRLLSTCGATEERLLLQPPLSDRIDEEKSHLINQIKDIARSMSSMGRKICVSNKTCSYCQRKQNQRKKLKMHWSTNFASAVVYELDDWPSIFLMKAKCASFWQLTTKYPLTLYLLVILLVAMFFETVNSRRVLEYSKNTVKKFTSLVTTKRIHVLLATNRPLTVHLIFNSLRNFLFTKSRVVRPRFCSW